jgi:hypothetical protein
MLDRYGIKRMREIREHAKATWGEEFTNDEDAFVEAFMTGEFHEEQADWSGLAAKLNPSELANLFPPIAHFLVATGVRQGDPELPIIIKFQEALVAWRDCHLKHPVEILDALRDFGEVMKVKATGEWGFAILGYFEILRSGILNRMGCWPMSEKLK